MKVTPDFGQLPLERTAGPAKEMLSVRRDSLGKTHVRINYSSLAVLQTCMRKSQLMLGGNYRSKVESPATAFGSAIHSALEYFYKIPRAERTLPTRFAEAADLLLGAYFSGNVTPPDEPVLRAIWKFLQKAEPLKALPASDKRSLDAGVWVLRHYFEKYLDDPFVVLCDPLGVPYTERFCEAPLHDSADLAITYFGTVDVILQNERTGVILPADHKTSSIVGNDFYIRLKPNLQYSGYVFLAREALHLDVEHFLVNCLQVKPRPTTSRGQPPNFPRQVTRRTPNDLEEFRSATVYWVRRYVEALASDDWPIGDVNACSHYGGCQYHQVCEAPSELRQNILDVNFLKGGADATTV